VRGLLNSRCIFPNWTPAVKRPRILCPGDFQTHATAYGRWTARPQAIGKHIDKGWVLAYTQQEAVVRSVLIEQGRVA